MSHQPSAWGHEPIKDWDHYIKCLDAYIKSVGERVRITLGTRRASAGMPAAPGSNRPWRS